MKVNYKMYILLFAFKVKYNKVYFTLGFLNRVFEGNGYEYKRI